MKILFATDGSPCSEVAAEAIAARPWPKGSEFRVISAAQPPAAVTTETWALPDDYHKSLAEGIRHQAQEAVEKAAGHFNVVTIPPGSVSIALLSGKAVNVILDEAERWGADLIVVGSHGRHGVARLLLGSVSQAVVSHAKCSVEIVRCKMAMASQSESRGRC